jgi:hypothetical protein
MPTDNQISILVDVASNGGAGLAPEKLLDMIELIGANYVEAKNGEGELYHAAYIYRWQGVPRCTKPAGAPASPVPRAGPFAISLSCAVQIQKTRLVGPNDRTQIIAYDVTRYARHHVSPSL